MIIFYDKDTGKIRGTIEGRVHPKEHLNMWIGDKDENERLVVQWKVVKKEPVENEVEVIEEVGQNEDGEKLYKKVKKKVKQMRNVYAPDTNQVKLFNDFDSNKKQVMDYKVDLKTKKLVKDKSKNKKFSEAVKKNMELVKKKKEV